MTNPDETQDDDGPIYEPVRLTPYDRRSRELRDLQAKRELLMAQDTPDESLQKRIAILNAAIERAQQRFDRESERAKDDYWRKLRGIDEWRAREGREQRNQSRRRVRQHPNANLSAMTAAQKAQHERDRRSDANWFKRQRDRHLSEAAITAAYMLRVQDRDAKRAAAERDARDIEAMQNDPGFGIV